MVIYRDADLEGNGWGQEKDTLGFSLVVEEWK